MTPSSGCGDRRVSSSDRRATSTISLRADFGKFVRQLARRSCDRSATSRVSQHRPGIEPCLHLHDRHAGHLVAGEDRALDRRRAAPARQQRGVDVEAAQPRRVEDRLAAGSARRPRPPRHRRRAPRTRPAPRRSSGWPACAPRSRALRRASGPASAAAPCRARRAGAAGNRPRRPRARPSTSASSVGTAKSGRSHEDDPHAPRLWRDGERQSAYLAAAWPVQEIEALSQALARLPGLGPALGAARGAAPDEAARDRAASRCSRRSQTVARAAVDLLDLRQCRHVRPLRASARPAPRRQERCAWSRKSPTCGRSTARGCSPAAIMCSAAGCRRSKACGPRISASTAWSRASPRAASTRSCWR